MNARSTVHFFLHLLVCCFLIVGCSGNKRLAPVDDRSSVSGKKSADWYTVRKGDTLYSISFAHGRDYLTVARLNKIQSPYTIYPGQRLRITGKPKPVEKQKPVKKVTKKTARKSSYSKKATKTRTTSKSSASIRVSWRWPVNGRVIRRYSETAPRKKGIGIGGKTGQTILSAAKGKVVYSGNGLIGYGNLIIIKHNSIYLSAYAHNEKVYVKEGQSVNAGQKIASMGRDERNTPMLHFEIRRHGKPVNPISYLPRRNG
ncbi:MAG: LysM peptidoglycan-binding domain-containing protein [Gammaproteobacteria bacterium]|nr:MAG: LysM peptidoglycan-binding domain-containing protein [Gammaproteobacteria bacterium]